MSEKTISKFMRVALFLSITQNFNYISSKKCGKKLLQGYKNKVILIK